MYIPGSIVYFVLFCIATPSNYGLIKVLSPNLAIFNSIPIEIYLFVMHYGSKALNHFCKSLLKFSSLLIMGSISRLSPVQPYSEWGGGIFTPPNELSQISKKLRRPKACAFLYATKN